MSARAARRRGAWIGPLAIGWVLCGSAAAADDAPAPVEASVHGDVKTFVVASFPPSAAATGQGIADLRLKGNLKLNKAWSLTGHQTLTTFGLSPGAGLAGAGAGVGLLAPQLIDLTRELDTVPDGAPDGTEQQLVVRWRTDRATARLSVPGLDLTLGRQPVTFGSGNAFTPMDVVNPFNAATIDTEYKPGVDAIRADGYLGTSGRITGVAAWAGAPVHKPECDRVEGAFTGDPRDDPRPCAPVGLTDLILVANGQATIGVTDVQLLVGAVRAEPVFGAGVVSSVGPVGVHGDATLTLPHEDAREDDPFVRAVIGADWRPTTTTTLSSEAYYQGFGAADPSGYLAIFLSDRFARSEVWQVGRAYASLAVIQEITPLIVANVAVIANLGDPSALIAPGVSWSVSGNASMSLGMFAGVGRAPDLTSLDPIRSEFGTYPPAAFLQLRAYF